MSRLALAALVPLLVACGQLAPARSLPPSSPPLAATPEPAPTPVALGPAQYRGLWADAFHDGFKSQAQAERLLQDAQRANVNALFVQVRKAGDAYYNDSLEPRATDIQGPARFDPLAFLIKRAHSANPRLEVHAWVNVFYVGRTSAVWQRHPDWVNRTAGGTTGPYLDPGSPGALAYTHEVFMHLASAYDLDGLHLDFVRYPEGGDWGYSPDALAAYGQGSPDPADPAWSQWRRDRVTGFVRDLYRDLAASRPHLKLSAALIPWGAGPADAAGFAASRAYSEVYQDWRGWLEAGILDLAVVMNYDTEWSRFGSKWFDQWTEFEKDHQYGRRVLIGVGAYFNYPEDTLDQIRRALAPSAHGNFAAGVAIYSYASTSVYGTDDYYAHPDAQDTLPRQPYASNPKDLNSLAQRAAEFNRGFWDLLAKPGAYTDPVTEAQIATRPVFTAPAAIPVLPWK
ncbi:MAG TPA: family 10 glycosylhydrolase [Candidatus Dormibacteraeota bacterium]